MELNKRRAKILLAVAAILVTLSVANMLKPQDIKTYKNIENRRFKILSVKNERDNMALPPADFSGINAIGQRLRP
jgi:hypothetical protein